MSIRHAMLALLSEGPKYGLQLREEFEERTGEVWPLNVGQVYTTLQRLDRDGLIAAVSSDPDGEADDSPQKAYRITDTGRNELAAWLRTPPDLSSPPRDELVMKILVSLRVPGTDPREVIQAHRRYLVELMQQWTRIKDDAAEDDLSTQLAVDAELFRLDSVVRWLDSAEARVRRAVIDGALTWGDQQAHEQTHQQTHEQEKAQGQAQGRKTQPRSPLQRYRRETRTGR